MANLDQYIIDKCKSVWEGEFAKGIKNKNNCSGFVKGVAKELGVPLPETANADGIIDAISRSWTPVNDGADAASVTSLT